MIFRELTALFFVPYQCHNLEGYPDCGCSKTDHAFIVFCNTQGYGGFCPLSFSALFQLQKMPYNSLTAIIFSQKLPLASLTMVNEVNICIHQAVIGYCK